jgi:hypothetical protein
VQVGSFFGELEFLGVSESRSMTLKAVVYCETATLLPEDISDVFVRHPFLRSRFERYANMQQEVDRMVDEGADMDEIAAKLKESAPGLEHSASGWSAPPQLTQCFHPRSAREVQAINDDSIYGASPSEMVGSQTTTAAALQLLGACDGDKVRAMEAILQAA